VSAPAVGLGRIQHLRELTLHLASRDLRSTHRRAALGWAWPLVLQLMQLGVLVFVFQGVLDLGMQDYPTYIFVGLVFFTWFQYGLISATGAVAEKGALVSEPRMSPIVLPVVALLVAAFDTATALPVLALLVGFTTGFTWAALWVPVILGIQAVLMLGLALILSAAHVYVRDVKPLVTVLLLMIFYLTPIFWTVGTLPDSLTWAVQLNPAFTLVDGYHSVLYYGVMPDTSALAILGLVSLGILALGVLVFRRLQPRFVDDL
jgi:ABC-type polysaccharide/polyol phosphate export permease